MDVRHLIGKVAGFPWCVGMSPTDTLICWILVKLLYICLVPNFSACPRGQHLSRRWLFVIDG